jgi:hypothetical protein
MKNLIIIFLSILVLTACQSNKTKIIGKTWKQTSKICMGSDTITSIYLYKILPSGEVFTLIENSEEEKILFKNIFNIDTLDFKGIKFISKNEYTFTNEFMKKNRNSLGNGNGLISFYSVRTNEDDFKIPLIIFELFNNFYQKNISLDISKRGDGSIFYKIDIYEEDKNIYEIEKEIKFFIDKKIKGLPIKSKEYEFSSWSRTMCSIYTWENLEYKLLMENYFHLADVSDNYDYNDKDMLEIKIWLDIK